MLLFIFEYSYKINHQINGTYYKQEEPNWWTSHYASLYIFKLLKKRNVIGLDVLGWITLFLFHGFPLTLFFFIFRKKKCSVFLLGGQIKNDPKVVCGWEISEEAHDSFWRIMHLPTSGLILVWKDPAEDA